MIELIKKHRKFKPNRKNYYIKWNVKFLVDRHSTYMIYTLLPTIVWVPWYNRTPTRRGLEKLGDCVCDVTWWKYHILIGEFFRKEKKNG